MINWDYNSDQPYIIKDKKLKKAKRKKYLWSYLYTYIVSLIVMPIALIFKIKIDKPYIVNIFGMSVNIDKDQKLTKELLSKLGIKKLLIRVYLCDYDKLDLYIPFIKSLKEYKITFKIIQSSDTLSDKTKLANSMDKVFKRLTPFSKEFIIGSTINRTKWGFFSNSEYIEFYKIVNDLRDSKYSDISLIGGSVIDFEFYNYSYILFNRKKVKFDAISSLLYVDRRGAPENKQSIIFNLQNKIELLYSMVRLSKKCISNKIIISETNYPLKETYPYAPTSEKECVDIVSYSNYMLRYYLNAIATKKVDTIFWHQLIATGYGLVDARDNTIRESFNTLAVLVSHVNQAELLNYNYSKEIYTMKFCKNKKVFSILWCNGKTKIIARDGKTIYSDNNKLITKNDIKLSDRIIYIYEN